MARASHASGRRLWDKNEPLDALIEQFTVGDDYRLDRALVAADCVASLAHATMLAAIGVITPAQLEELRAPCWKLWSWPSAGPLPSNGRMKTGTPRWSGS